ncbi:DUF3040 domain-containing protein [Pseudonocardia sp. McavD-2-B]|uniref:DUF3040 domain-containing protein n=1 Tax=Pseudonocardia sp. McavD-2-B TaxID=2954499 RepID=UPI002097CF5D|nr:DUF3040 domain-containing protein [Pseudonocardia sp. McavD-2-B]MCO7196210.1 DUF3040 domain-containing protein [Pseudonocardia sp. McavD-2-B]
MLSEGERRRLVRIEHELTAEAPRLARRLRNPSRLRVWLLPAAAATLGLVAAVGLLALGRPGDALVLGALGCWPVYRLLERRRVWHRLRTRFRARSGGGGSTSRST